MVWDQQVQLAIDFFLQLLQSFQGWILSQAVWLAECNHEKSISQHDSEHV